MTAQELRIGNYVQGKNEIIKIVGLRETSDFLEWIKPITLTEEWLLKFGFEKYVFKVNETYQKTSDTLYRINMDKYDTIIISLSKMFSFPMLKNKDGKNYYLRGITSVHQLQNLFFALTGEELTIKETVS